MPNTVESKVVQMKMDNRDFERKANQSIKTLDNLDNRLRFSEGTKGFDGLEKAIDSVQYRMSAFGIMGARVLSNLADSAFRLSKNLLSAIPKQIIEGGKNRALNIEQAKFQLEGLGIAWKDIEGDIDYGVKDTAYGLDAAAKAAAQLSASGIQVGDSMKQALRGISGVAAMTNSTYEDISDVFTTVAGQGRVMANDLNRLSARGLNAAATLAKSMGITEENLRKMVSQGKIDFATFAKAMDDAYGQHAKDANNTFTGALSNMKAALSRIGADFATPILPAMRDIFNAFRTTFNGIRKLTKPFADNEFTKWVNDFTVFATRIIGNLNFDWIGNIMDKLSGLREKLSDFFGFGDFTFLPSNIFNAFSIALANVKLDDIGGNTEKWNANLVNLKRTLTGVSSAIGIIHELIDRVKTKVGILFKSFGAVGSTVLKVTGAIGDFITSAYGALSGESLSLNSNFILVQQALSGLVAIVEIAEEPFIALWQVLNKYKVDLSPVGNAFLRFAAAIGRGLSAIRDFIKNSNIFFRIFDSIAKAVIFVKNAISSFFDRFKNGFKSAESSVGGFKVGIDGVKNSFVSTREVVKKTFSIISSSIQNTTGNIKSLSSRLLGLIKETSQRNGLSQLFSFFKKGEKPEEKIEETVDAIEQTVNKKVPVFKRIATSIAAIFTTSGILNEGIFAGFGVSLIKFVSTVSKAIDSFTKAAVAANKASFVGVLDSLRMCFTKYQASIKAGVLLKIAAAIGILAWSLVAVANADQNGMASGLAGMVTMLISVMSLVMFMQKYMDVSAIDKGAFKTLLQLSLIIRVLASAMVELSSIQNPGGAIFSLIGLVGTLMIFLKYLDVGEGAQGLSPKVGMALIGIAAALVIMSVAVASLGSLDFATLGKGVLAIAALLGIIGGFAILSNLAPGILKTSIALVFFGVAITLLSAGLLILSKLKDIKTGLIGITLLLAVIAAFSVATGAIGGGMLVSSIALVIFAGAILVLTASLAALAAIGLKGVITGIIAIAAAFAVIGLAAAILTPLIPGILLLSVAMALIGASVLMAAVGVSIFAAALLVLGTSAVVAVTGIVAAFGILSTGIKLIATTIANGLTAFISAFLEGINGMVGAIANAGASLILALLNSISGNAMPIGRALLDIILGLMDILVEYTPALVDKGIAAMIALVNGLADGLRNHTDEIFDAIKNLISAILEMILSMFQAILGGIPGIGEKINSALETAKLGLRTFMGTDEAESAGSDFATSVATGIEEGASDIPEATEGIGADTGAGFIKGLTDSLPDISAAAKGVGPEVTDAISGALEIHSPSRVTEELGRNTGLGFINGLKESFGQLSSLSESLANSQGILELLKSLATSMKELIDGLGDNLLSGAKNAADKVVTAVASRLRGKNFQFRVIGVNAAKGYVEGIQSQITYAAQMGERLSQATIDSLKQILGIHSPSKVLAGVGSYAGEGFVLGLSSWIGKASEQTEAMGLSAVASAESIANSIRAILSGEMSDAFVITPVLDLSSVRSSARSINSLFNYGRTMSVDMSRAQNAENEQVQELVTVGWRILRAIQNGSDLYLDDKVLAGRINRRLGQL